MAAVSLSCPSCKTLLPSDGTPMKGPITCQECGLIMTAPLGPGNDGRWSYARGGKKYGPFTLAELRRHAGAGHFQRTDMVLQEGTTVWAAAETVPSLFPQDMTPEGPPPLSVQPRSEKPETRANPSAKVPSSPGTRGSESSSPGMGRRVLNEILATCKAPVTQVARLARYGRMRWCLRSLRREDRAARLALGQRAYEVGAGDQQLRMRIAAVDEEIGRLETAKSSAKRARGERDQIILQVAEQVRASPVPPRGVEAAWDRVGRAGGALQNQQCKLTDMAREMKPVGAAEWRRVLLGFGAASILIAVLLLLLWPSRAVIKGIDRERELAQAVGWVITGGKITLATGTEMEFATTSGSCFAVSADGYLLTNKHVVKDTWADLHVATRKQDLEALAKRYGVTAEPMVWVFFGKEKHVGRILYVSPDYDLAVLKVERGHVPFFRLSTADSPPRGMKVVACGFPGASRVALGEEEILEGQLREQRLQLTMKSGKRVRVEDRFSSSAFEFDRTEGTVSRPVNEERGPRWIQHHATIHHGNSGGPLLTEDGTVVGINTLGNPNTHGVYRSLSMPQLQSEINRHISGVVWK